MSTYRHRHLTGRPEAPSPLRPAPTPRRRSVRHSLRSLTVTTAGLALVLSGTAASAAPVDASAAGTMPSPSAFGPAPVEDRAPRGATFVPGANTALRASDPSQQLANRLLPRAGVTSLKLQDVPAGATAVSLRLTTGGARTGTLISGCAGTQTPATCTTPLMAIPRWSGSRSTRTVLVELGGEENDTITLTSSAASIRLGVLVLGFVTPDPVSVPAPAAAPAPAPATASPKAAAAPALATSPANSADPDGPGAWPTAANTGVPAGTALTASGSITVTQDGAVVDGLAVNGGISVRANNVTIKNTKISGGEIDNGGTGLLIQDVEIDGSGADYVYAAVSYSDFTAVRMNIHGVGIGFHATDNIVVRDSYVHDLVVQGDPANGGTHNEAFLSNGGRNMVITNNRFTAGLAANFSSSLSIYGDFEQVDNVLVANNLFNGGGYCVYAGSVSGKPYPVATNTRFTGNTFGRELSSNCGGYGPVISYESGGGNAWTGNVWAGGGAVNP